MLAFEANLSQTRGIPITLRWASNELVRLIFFFGMAEFCGFQRDCFYGHFVQRALTMTTFIRV